MNNQDHKDTWVGSKICLWGTVIVVLILIILTML